MFWLLGAGPAGSPIVVWLEYTFISLQDACIYVKEVGYSENRHEL
jgi:hypothetical protein